MENGQTANPSKIRLIERFTQEITEDSTLSWGEGLYLVMLGFFPWSGFQGNHYHNFLTKNTSRKSQESNNLMTTRCDSEVSMTIIYKIFTFSQYRLSDLQLIPTKWRRGERSGVFAQVCRWVGSVLSFAPFASPVRQRCGASSHTTYIWAVWHHKQHCFTSSSCINMLPFITDTHLRMENKKRGTTNAVEGSVSRKSDAGCLRVWAEPGVVVLRSAEMRVQKWWCMWGCVSHFG